MLAKPDPRVSRSCPGAVMTCRSGGCSATSCCRTDHPLCRPRWVLKRQLAKAAQQGFTFYTHPEIEFFLFNETPDEGRDPVPVDNVGYFDHSPHPAGQDFRRQAISTLEHMGISVEFSHHEGGPGQQEIDLRVTPTR